VAAWGDTARTYRTHSMRKSFMSALMGMAADEGKVDTGATLAALGIEEKTTLTAVERQATVAGSIATHSGYGFMWWIQRNDAPAIPPIETVIVNSMNTDEPGPRVSTDQWDRLLGKIMAARLEPALPAQEAGGYYRVAGPALPDSLREVNRAARFSITVERWVTTPFERRLVEHAESLFPPADSIDKAARPVTGAGHVDALQAAKAIPGARWWWREWDYVLLPYALTGQAVQHYIDRVRALSAQPNPFAAHNVGVEHKASLTYTARVVPIANRQGAFEVHMKVAFSFYCGPLCALWFTHSRVVEFDETGRVIRVTGDGPPRITVS
jgi:hypothetical protein